MEKPLADLKLGDMVRNRKVCALVEDSTRGQPRSHQIEASAKRLEGAKHIQYIITTGSHDSKNEGNLEIARTIERIAKKHRLNHDILIHDCERPTVNIGTTTRGTKVEKLSTFDIEYLFLNIRGKSVGETVEVIVTCPDDGETQVPVVIDLDAIKIQTNPDIVSLVNSWHNMTFDVDILTRACKIYEIMVAGLDCVK